MFERPEAADTDGARLAGPGDLEAVVGLASALWPKGSVREHRAHMRAVLAGRPPSPLPLVVFVVQQERRIVGFIEVGLRSHADGCDARRPVGYVEGWFVAPSDRGRSIGRRLMDAAEKWATNQGCIEIASDTWIDNEPSQRAHQALGFQVVDRCVNFRKALGRTTGLPEPAALAKPTARQAEFLAFIARYVDLYGRAPAEADMVRHFKISPPSVHAMVLTLERRGFIAREPGQARSIRLRVPR
jgi:aminoglycoside 6'-N-acetyltransferase I